MSDTNEKTFTQLEINQLMMGHRKRLQQTIIDQEQTIAELRRQITQLSVPEVNPVCRMLLSAIGFVRKGQTNV